MISSTRLYTKRKKKKNFLEEPCYICGATEDIEMHHLKHLKDTKDKNTIIQIISRINRKTIPLCISCHNKVHTIPGKYDGMSLKDLKQKVCKFVYVFGEPYAEKLAIALVEGYSLPVLSGITVRVVDSTIHVMLI